MISISRNLTKRIIILGIIILLSCRTEKIDTSLSTVPAKNQIDRGGLIKRPDGPENRKRWEYYNGLQHKQNQPIKK